MTKASEYNRCTAQKRNGNFCDWPSLPDAPFPICVRHAGRLLHFLVDRVGTVDPTGATSVEAIRTATALIELSPKPMAAANAPTLTYYVAVDRVIKIGMTTNLKRRLAQYPPYARLLATEPGNVEFQRHREFAHLLKHGNEWFAPGPDLLAYIDKLRATQGRGPMRRGPAAA